MKQYQQPDIRVIQVSLEDVITGSPASLGYGYQDDIFSSDWGGDEK